MDESSTSAASKVKLLRYRASLFAPKQSKETKPGLNRELLFQISVCVLPAMLMVGLAKPATGARWFYLILLIFLARQLFLKDRFHFAAIVIGTMPAAMLFRNFFYYSSVSMFLFAALSLWWFTAPGEFAAMWANLRLRCLILLGGFYWLVSVYLERDYSANLRAMELLGAVVCVYLLINRWEVLASAFLGVAVSVIAMGLAFLPYGERLGAGTIDGYSLGNPISFGIPATLIFILTLADNGRWLLLERQRLIRLGIGLATGGLLLLSTSRGSWLVVLVNVFVLAVINRKQRKLLAAMIALLIVVGALLLSSSRGEYVQQSFDRTVSSERTLSSTTSGRSDQWWLFPEVFADSPLWGFGPGKGSEVYAHYSSLYNIFHSGKGMAWHSLYLQVGVETGLIGILLMTFLMAPLAWHGVTHYRLVGDSVPLHGILSFLIIGFSVSGLDAASGLFFGLGMLSENWRPALSRTTREARFRKNIGFKARTVDLENWRDGLINALGVASRRTANQSQSTSANH